MYIKLIISSIIVSALTTIGYQWKVMSDTIERKELEVKNLTTVVAVQAGNIEVMKEQFKDDIARKVFEATSKERKSKIKKELNYDTNKTVDINSTRIYL